MTDFLTVPFHEYEAKKRAKAAAKAIDRRVEKAYYAGCSNITIPMMKIQAVFKRGRELCAAGADNAALTQGIRDFVETIRVES